MALIINTIAEHIEGQCEVKTRFNRGPEAHRMGWSMHASIIRTFEYPAIQITDIHDIVVCTK